MEKKCRQCKKKFETRRGSQQFCQYLCYIRFAIKAGAWGAGWKVKESGKAAEKYNKRRIA